MSIAVRWCEECVDGGVGEDVYAKVVIQRSSQEGG